LAGLAIGFGNYLRLLLECDTQSSSGGLVILIRGGGGLAGGWSRRPAVIGLISCYKKVRSRSNSFSWIFIFPAGTQYFDFFLLGFNHSVMTLDNPVFLLVFFVVFTFLFL